MTPPLRSLAALSVLALSLPALAALSGCGPVLSTYLVIQAQAQVDAATAAEAPKYAVYEYTAAEEYLHKSREEQGYADFGPSIDFALKAQDMAKKATDRASEEKKRMMDQGGDAPAWQEPSDNGEQPKVIIKKKDAKNGEDVKVKIVPIPVEEGPKPK